MEFLFITIATVTLLIIAGIAFYGGFRKIRFSRELAGGELFVYKKHVGDYKYSAPIMDHIYHTLEHEFNIITHKGCGIYYDNPKTTNKHKLKADIGCILKAKDHDKLPKIKELFEVKEIPRLKNITTSFPYHGKFSVFMSIIRVYPALDTYLKKNNLTENGPVIEIYDIPNKVILFRKELSEENK